MVGSVRPKEVFTLVQAPSNVRIVQVKLPDIRAGIFSVETLLLMAAMKLTPARRIFEFGTLRGSTTLNLALNCAPDGQVFPFDLAPEEKPLQLPADAKGNRGSFRLHSGLCQQHGGIASRSATG
jgi:hypothetical protein